MIIALTYNKENNTVFGHFGAAEYFYLYDLEKEEGKVIDNGGFSHAALVPYLKNLGVNVLICGGIGSHAIELLEKNDIKVYPGASGNVLDVINKLKNNKLIADLSAVHQCSHNH